MTDWIPGLSGQLRHHAEHAARQTTKPAPTRRRGRAGLGVLIAVLGVSSAAYAAQGLWRPQIGDRDGQAVASAAAPPKTMLDAFAVLRREQTQADRGAQAAYALRHSEEDVVSVKTNYVRILGTNREGQPIVLIPQTTRDPQTGVDEEHLCIWVQSPAGSNGAGGKGCNTTQRAIDGQLAIGSGTPAGDLAIVALVRDGATTAQVGEDPRRVEVTGNLVQALMPERSAGNLEVTTYDAQGKQLDAPPPFAINAHPTAAQEALLRRLLSRQKIGAGQDPLAYLNVATGLCGLIGADPRPTPTQLRTQTIRRYQAAGVTAFDERDAAFTLEVVSATYCLRR